ncbi:hypothetical protein EPN28_03325 [Patescibacteria group bacterium]|nr:MAG: hypothetical protein EPN28_03325 [Patescibacteria group bacterium]
MKWRINFDIRDVNFNMLGYYPQGIFAHIPKKNGKQLFTVWYQDYRNDRDTAYVPVEVIETTVKWIAEKIITEPQWAEELHARTEKLNWDYFNYAQSLVGKDFGALNNAELFDYYKTLLWLTEQGHLPSIATTWFVDSDGMIFSEYLKQKLGEHLKSLGIDDPVKTIEYFVLLTTPAKQNFVQLEQLDFLELLKAVVIPAKAGIQYKELITKHWQKWRWTPYGYIGPAYDLKYYEEQVKEALPRVTDPDQMLKEEKERYEKLIAEQNKVISEINLPPQLARLFAIAREIIWLKDLRKYCIWHGHYVLDMLTKEIAKRLNISHKQANHFLTDEMENALLRDKLDIDLINERIKHCVIEATESGTKYYYGKEADAIIAGLDIEEIKLNVEDGFKGATAYPGFVSGKVKVVLSLTDADKVEKGDIMLALTTYPAMLPAMKRASAIVTEDGGITCHAAIVAREFKIPCVVGVKKITSVLKDGDMVKVDATSGVVRKI